MKRFAPLFITFVAAIRVCAAATAVTVTPVTAPHGMVVAGHPEAAAIGRDVLAQGGNAIDAAVAVSLALGVAEPYGSGLGGKLVLLYHDARSRSTHVVDGLDQAGGALDPQRYRLRPTEARRTGWTAVCVPGLPAALHAAHARWGKRPWADNVAPAIVLARSGFTVQPKTRTQFLERIDKLRAEPALAALYLRDDDVPPGGTRLPNSSLAATLEQFAQHGADGFYRGPVADAIAAAARAGGGHLTHEDLASYRPRFTTPLQIEFAGNIVLSAPPPTNGAILALALLKVLESETLAPPLRTAENIDLIGRAWRVVYPEVQRAIADTAEARAHAEAMLTEQSVARYRAAAFAGDAELQPVMAGGDADATTHFVIVDAEGNVVSATQSLSLHFGAGVVAAGVILNDSMSNFAYDDLTAANAAAPGKRPRSTITPTIVLDRRGAPALAIGLPGAGRIPTAMLHVLLDHLRFERPLEEALGDTRLHWQRPFGREAEESIEVETSLSADTVSALRQRGWKVDLIETPGTGLHFGGINAIRVEADGSRTGYADPRRTNAAAGH